MLTTASFIATETNAHRLFARDLLIKIEHLRADKVQQHTYSFNVYDLEVDLNKSEVMITENLYHKTEEFLKLSLSTFTDDLLDILNS
jgi:hypothetical protein